MLLYSPLTERRLFGALMAEPQVLAWCDGVETDDFSDLHLKFSFIALRNVCARGEALSMGSVADELDRLGYIQVDVGRVAQTLLEPPYNAEEMLVRIDARWLRRMANRRRNAV